MIKIYVPEREGELHEILQSLSADLSVLPLSIESVAGEEIPTEENEFVVQARHLGENLTSAKLASLKEQIQRGRIPAVIAAKPSQYSARDMELIQDFLGGLSQQHYFLNLESPSYFESKNLLHFLTTLFTRPSSKEKNTLEQLGASLNAIIQNSLSELQKIKKIHEKVVPMRRETFKGLTILSKFSAGESPGGEFFDFVKGEQAGLLLMSSSSSYIISSTILAHFEVLKNEGNFSNEGLEKFIQDLGREIKDKDFSSNKDRIELFVARVDLSRMTLEGYSFGHFLLYNKSGAEVERNQHPVDEAFMQNSGFRVNLGRGERYTIFSPGSLQNLQGVLGENEKKFFAEVLEKGGREMINELFFQMNRHAQGGFLKTDATVLSLEVDENVIRQI